MSLTTHIYIVVKKFKLCTEIVLIERVVVLFGLEKGGSTAW